MANKKGKLTVPPKTVDFIEVFGAREHNLKNVDIKIPKTNLLFLQV